MLNYVRFFNADGATLSKGVGLREPVPAVEGRNNLRKITIGRRGCFFKVPVKS